MRWKDRSGNETFEIEVAFESGGYADPGQTYGPPESCYPPEGEVEDLKLVEMTIGGKAVPEPLATALFDFLSERIEESIMEEPPEYDPPEPDDVL